MRVRLTLDEDAHNFAAYYARVRGISLGVGISELICKAQSAPAPKSRIRIRTGPNGLPKLPRTGRTITCEMVNKIEGEEYDPRRYR
jgi:hypothetical protein